MRASSFTGSLAFAVLAALGSVPWMIAASPIGRSWALGTYSLGAAVVYLVWIAPSWRRGLAAGAGAGLGALVLALLTPMPTGAVMGAALVLATVRSGYLFRCRPARAFVVESVLAGGGLAFAGALADGSLLGLGLAFWGYFLLQSAFFLIGGFTERPADGPRLDPFEVARRRALALMEDLP